MKENIMTKKMLLLKKTITTMIKKNQKHDFCYSKNFMSYRVGWKYGPNPKIWRGC